MSTKAEIKQALDALADLHGRLTPRQVVEAARDPDSPLHDQFDWDDESAADKHRLDIARRLIRSVTIVRTGKTTVLEAPAYVRDPDCVKKEQGYRSTRHLKEENDQDIPRRALIEEFLRARAIFERTVQIAAYFQMEETIEDFKRRIDLSIAELRSEPDRPDA